MKPNLDVLTDLGVIKTMTPKGNEVRGKMRALLIANEAKIADSYEKAEFPMYLMPELAAIGVGGMQTPIKYGGLGLSFTDALVIGMEGAKYDAGIATFIGVHDYLGNCTIAECGDEE